MRYGFGTEVFWNRLLTQHKDLQNVRSVTDEQQDLIKEILQIYPFSNRYTSITDTLFPFRTNDG